MSRAVPRPGGLLFVNLPIGHACRDFLVSGFDLVIEKRLVPSFGDKPMGKHIEQISGWRVASALFFHEGSNRENQRTRGGIGGAVVPNGLPEILSRKVVYCLSALVVHYDKEIRLQGIQDRRQHSGLKTRRVRQACKFTRCCIEFIGIISALGHEIEDSCRGLRPVFRARPTVSLIPLAQARRNVCRGMYPRARRAARGAVGMREKFPQNVIAKIFARLRCSADGIEILAADIPTLHIGAQMLLTFCTVQELGGKLAERGPKFLHFRVKDHPCTRKHGWQNSHP